MKKKILSVLLSVIITVTSINVTAYAIVLEDGTTTDIQVTELETLFEQEQSDETEELVESIESSNISMEIETDEEISKEIESLDEQASNINSTQMDETSEMDQSQRIEDVTSDEVSEEIISETFTDESQLVSEENKEREECETTEEIIVESSTGLNAAMKQKILSFQSRYPEGKNWDPSGNGWRNLAWECYGFVITLEGLIFKDYPTNKHLRSTLNGKTAEGWTCYYVTGNNYNSLTVEPGDILDCPTSKEWNHTAMVLSVDNGKITCVQANNNGNNLVYWTQCFNYSAGRTTLKNIYNDYSRYNVIKLAPAT